MKKFLPIVILLLGAAYLVSSLRPPPNKTAFDLQTFGQLPVLMNGRIKPLDTVARTSLLTMQGRQPVSDPTISEPLVDSPIQWLAEVFFNPTKADDYPTFRVSGSDSPELVSLMGLTDEQVHITYDDSTKRALAMADFLPGTRTRFSYNQLRPKLAELDRQARLAEPVDNQVRTGFQKQVIVARDRLVLYLQLKTSMQVPDSPDFLQELELFDQALPAGIRAVLAKQKGEAHDEAALKAMMTMAERASYLEELGNLRVVPPAAGDTDPTHWRPTGTALIEAFSAGHVDTTIMDYARLGHAWRAGDAATFNRIVGALHTTLAARYPDALHKSDNESRFNAAEPFYKSMVLYAFAGVIALFSWLIWPEILGRIAFNLVFLAFLVATAGIATRMWLEGRPPVTNLYSSALFIGWGAVGFCLILERIFRNAIGSVAAGIIGFITLLIAHHLSLSGDTLEMMRAVLDTNLWLATHVVIVTTGYAATFLAGFLAIIYIVMGVFTPWLARKPTTGGAVTLGAVALSPGLAAAAVVAARRSDTNARMIESMVYGIVCLATLCSLVGTVLGGIWADQSWGRFWGWDPKENGALMIVVWNAVILHCRWGGLVKQRGLMALATFGNIVTSWSWFGTNMLGVGLHSYGFMDSAFYWLIAFVASQLAFIALALLPLDKWRSFKAT